MFEKGELVVRILNVGGSKTATIQQVHDVEERPGVVVIRDPVTEEINHVHFYDPATGHLTRDSHGVPGTASYLVKLDGGEEARLINGFGDLA